jgi:hypothetical protein
MHINRSGVVYADSPLFADNTNSKRAIAENVGSHPSQCDALRLSGNLDEFRFWFSGMMSSARDLPPDELTSKVALITPEIAGFLLTSFNKSNRTLKPTKIKRFIALMKADRWRVTHQGISFSRSAMLNNGQNRLTAIAQSGVPVKLYLTFGEERSTFSVIDADMTVRGGADTAHVLGYKNTANLAAAARLLKNIEAGSFAAAITVGNDEIKDLVDSHPGLEEATTPGQRIGTRLRVAPSAMTIASYVIGRDAKDLRRFEVFVDRLCDGDGLRKFDPIFILREMIKDKSIDAGVRNSASRSITHAASTIKTWNLWVRGKRAKQADIKWEVGDAFPSVE